MNSTNRRVLRPLVLSIMVAVAVGLPVFLTGALTGQLRRALAVDTGIIGLSVSAAFLVGAILTVPFGRLVDRVGSKPTLVASTLISASSALGVATIGTRTTLMPLLAVAGIGASLGNSSINRFLTQAVDPQHLSFAFGINKAAFPGAALLAGIAVPVLTEPYGWRWGYVLAGVVAVGTTSALAQAKSPTSRSAVLSSRERSIPLRITKNGVLLAMGALLGTSASIGATIFVAPAAIEAGGSIGNAGLVLAAGSGVAILTRVVLGRQVGNNPGKAFGWVIGVLATGAAGYLVLMFVSWPWFALAAALVVGVSSGWIGLLAFGIAASDPQRPASATALMESSAFLGAVLGPAAFGAIAQYGSFTLAWFSASMAAFGAAVVVFLSISRASSDPNAPSGQ